MRLCNAEVYISHSILVHMHLIYTANLCSQEVKYKVLLNQIFDMQLLPPPQQAQIMHWLLSLKKTLAWQLITLCIKGCMFWGLRWHGSHSAEVNKNINLGYSHDQGYS